MAHEESYDLSAVFRIRLFFRVRIGLKSGSDPEKSGSVKKRPKNRVEVETNVILHILHSSHVFFGQAPSKPYQNHHLDHIIF